MADDGGVDLAHPSSTAAQVVGVALPVPAQGRELAQQRRQSRVTGRQEAAVGEAAEVLAHSHREAADVTAWQPRAEVGALAVRSDACPDGRGPSHGVGGGQRASGLVEDRGAAPAAQVVPGDPRADAAGERDDGRFGGNRAVSLAYDVALAGRVRRVAAEADAVRGRRPGPVRAGDVVVAQGDVVGAGRDAVPGGVQDGVVGDQGALRVRVDAYAVALGVGDGVAADDGVGAYRTWMPWELPPGRAVPATVLPEIVTPSLWAT